MLALFVPLFLVALVVLTLCAPYIMVDGAVFTTSPMNDFVIPHAAPLYPLFVRSVNAIVHNATVLADFSPAAGGPAWSLFKPVPYGNVSIYAILFVQHALLVWAASWFAVSITERWWLRVTTALALCWSPPILAVAQRIMTEGLWNPVVIAVVASSYRFLVRPQKPLLNLALHYTFVALAMLVRHPGVVLLAILPLALVLLGVARAIGRRRTAVLRPHLRAAIVAVGFGLVTLGVVSAVENAVLDAYDIEPRSIYGRAGTTRIHHMGLHPFEGMSREDLDEVIEGLERRAGDLRIREAIRIIATSKSAWVEPFNRVHTEIVKPTFPHHSVRQTLAETDRILNQVALLAYTSTDPRMLRSVALRAARFLQLGPHGRGTLSRQMDNALIVAEWNWLKKDQLAKVSAARNVRKLRRTFVLEWAADRARPLEARFLWLVVVVLAGFAVARGRFGSGASIGIAVVATTMIYASLLAVVAYYSRRRSEVIVLLAVCAVALLGSELAERGTSRSDRGKDDSGDQPL